MLLLMGYGVLALGLFSIAWAVVVSYRTKGGSLGQIPVLAQGVQAALLITLGVAIIGSRQAWADMAWPAYVVLFVLLATVFCTGIVQVGRAATKIRK